MANLNKLFAHVANLPIFSVNGNSIFGPQPSTAFLEGDEQVAFELFRATSKAFAAHLPPRHGFDALNEAFGHFVRDNFRNHIEDAQHMTPYEVVEFMVDVAAELILPKLSGREEILMMDPTCGTGSFLTAWRKKYDKLRKEYHPALKVVGQDKVDRMARLASVNMILSGVKTAKLYIGNSLWDDAPLSQYNGKVDLILTNPPFGASFELDEIRQRASHRTPFFSKLRISARSVDSEFLFLDRYLSLLRPGGLCLAIVPDSVVSAKGMAALTRQMLSKRAELRAVVELPSVTFAQAGTRTKTAIIVFEKVENPSVLQKVFFAEVDSLGYEVSKRKGVPIKRIEGRNQLPEVLNAFRKGIEIEIEGLSRNQSTLFAIWRELNPRLTDAWTPRLFRALQSRRKLGKSELCKLSDLVEVPARRPRPVPYSRDKYFISVLHVIGEGLLDISSIKTYQPVTPGIPILPGQVIISRINPRIPRVLVVPDLGRELLCSSEFEVLVPKKGVSPYALAYVLLTPFVQEQIQSLTSGTSASHSRIKAEKLYEVVIPWPENRPAFCKVVENYALTLESIVRSAIQLTELRSKSVEALFSSGSVLKRESKPKRGKIVKLIQ